MTVEECFEYGRITKAHGFKGDVLIHLTTEHSKALKGVQSIFIKTNEALIPFLVEKVTYLKDSIIVKLEDINDESDVSPLVRSTVYLPLQQLPPLKKGEWYYHQIKGYQIIDTIKGALGTIGEVYEMPMQDLIGMQYNGQEVLIPLNDTFVQEANHEKKELYVTLPEGLIDLYLDAEHTPDDED